MNRAHKSRRLGTSRPPSEKEQQALTALFESQKKRFSEPDAKPWEFFAGDPPNAGALPNTSTPAEGAAWTAVARVLLNLDETITKE